MDAKSFISPTTFTSLMTCLIDLENSNLPIDYFTSVLPRAQYGDESAVSVGLDRADAVLTFSDSADNTKGAILVVVHIRQMIIWKKIMLLLHLLKVRMSLVFVLCLLVMV